MDHISNLIQTSLNRTHASVLKSGGNQQSAHGYVLDLERYYREDSASDISNDIESTTGNSPRKFQDYIRETAAKGVLDADN